MKKLIIFLSFIFIFSSCSDKNTQKNISRLYIYHCSESSVPFEEYEIDFFQREFTILVRGGFIGMTNEVTKDNPVIKSLSEEDINEFLSHAEEKGVTNWKKEYNNIAVEDGHQWGIVIAFTDGSKKEIKGSNAYPETWDAMNDAFEALTGENILHVRSDWLDNH